MPYISDTAIINIQSAGEAHVFVKALYPEGFKQIGSYSINDNGKILLNLSDLRNAWQEEYKKTGRLSQPLIVLTIITKDGRVALESINFRWDKMTQSTTITPKFRKLQKTVEEVSRGKMSKSSKDVQPLAGYYQWLDDYYEWTAPTIVAQVTPDSSTFGDISYTYFINKKVGFSINVFVDSDWTRLTSYNIVQKDEGGKHSGSFATGQNYYIWMNVKYRYERWGIHIDGYTFYEEYVYVKDFYPSTLDGGTSKPSNAQIPPVDYWIYEGSYTSQGYDQPYYTFSIWDLGTNNFAMDVLKFIDVLEMAGKISSAAAQKASLIGLFIDVSFE